LHEKLGAESHHRDLYLQRQLARSFNAQQLARNKEKSNAAAGVYAGKATHRRKVSATRNSALSEGPIGRTRAMRSDPIERRAKDRQTRAIMRLIVSIFLNKNGNRTGENKTKHSEGNAYHSLLFHYTSSKDRHTRIFLKRIVS
jgi:hypothetical protein